MKCTNYEAPFDRWCVKLEILLGWGGGGGLCSVTCSELPGAGEGRDENVSGRQLRTLLLSTTHHFRD
jgi:hypothetical protein